MVRGMPAVEPTGGHWAPTFDLRGPLTSPHFPAAPSTPLYVSKKRKAGARSPTGRAAADPGEISSRAVWVFFRSCLSVALDVALGAAGGATYSLAAMKDVAAPDGETASPGDANIQTKDLRDAIVKLGFAPNHRRALLRLAAAKVEACPTCDKKAAVLDQLKVRAVAVQPLTLSR